MRKKKKAYDVGFKLLKADGTSLNGQYRYNLSGKWNKVPGNGSYVAVSGNLHYAGSGPLLVMMECRKPFTPNDGPVGVICYSEVRVMAINLCPLKVAFALALKKKSLSMANLRWANLSGANLSGANLRWASLSEANLTVANLTVANLRWANLSGADLSGANLCGANLRWANLSGADLSGADLCGANLSVANLSMANLRWANLSGANLSGADLSGANLSGAIGYEPKNQKETK